MNISLPDNGKKRGCPLGCWSEPFFELAHPSRCGLVLHVPESVDVAAVRRRTGLSQTAFSRRIGVSAATLRNWEQGRRALEGPARILLAMLERNPRIVEETLA